jgi:hypothetical protein
VHADHDHDHDHDHAGAGCGCRDGSRPPCPGCLHHRADPARLSSDLSTP